MSLRKINERDNVAVLMEGDGEIPAGHKIALEPIKKGEFVVKYGEVIGRATQDIQPGQWVHTHNLKSHLDENAEYHYHFQECALPKQEGWFWGYPRSWGRTGIRNEIYIIPTVGCVNSVCKQLERQAQELVTGTIDNIFCLPPPSLAAPNWGRTGKTSSACCAGPPAIPTLPLCSLWAWAAKITALAE